MLVSVIIPCYNVQEYIEECLDSVFKQSYSNLEVIVVDNNSNDDTYEILVNYKRNRQPKISILKESIQGASAARNKGLQYAKGEWIQFLDADDLLEVDKIAHQVSLIKPNTIFLVGASKHLDINNKKTIRLIPNQNYWVNLVQSKLGNTCSNLFKRSAVMDVNGWDVTLKSSQEADLMFRLLKSEGTIVVSNNPKTVIRARVSGQISNGSLENKMRFIELRLEIIRYLKAAKSELFLLHKNELCISVYNWIKKIGINEPDLGQRYYRELPEGFQPNTIKARLFKKLIDLLGFRFVMKVFKFAL